MEKELGLFVVIGAMAAFIAFSQYKNKKNAEKKDKESAARWAADYHNPASPNYDAARVAAEEAEAAKNPTIF